MKRALFYMGVFIGMLSLSLFYLHAKQEEKFYITLTAYCQYAEIADSINREYKQNVGYTSKHNYDLTWDIIINEKNIEKSCGSKLKKKGNRLYDVLGAFYEYEYLEPELVKIKRINANRAPNTRIALPKEIVLRNGVVQKIESPLPNISL